VRSGDNERRGGLSPQNTGLAVRYILDVEHLHVRGNQRERMVKKDTPFLIDIRLDSGVSRRVHQADYELRR
jgi:hypothetical protein